MRLAVDYCNKKMNLENKKVKMKLKALKAVSTVILGIMCVAPACASQTAIYKNQRGSILTLTWQDQQQNGAGLLTGTFNSAVGECAAGTTVPVIGNYSGNVIALTFNYPECKVVVALTGNLTNSDEEIHTTWLVTAQTVDPQKEDWNANTIGNDHFKKKH